MEIAKDPSLEVYKWEGVPLQPSCPMCKCIYNKLYCVGDIQAITLTLCQRSIQETAGKGPTHEDNLGSFLSQALFTGSQVVNNIACVQKQKGMPDLTSKQQLEIFYNTTTEHTTRMGSKLSGDAVELL